MTETQKNIQKYKAAIPGLKERVMAAAMLLVVSLSMVVSASFAWITLSVAPEVSMLTTTVAANGNLEIALVGPEGAVPGEVAIGDSASTPGKNLVSANVTWGNLVNLSDASYGLSEISLRPALLSQYGLDTEPLFGATYDADGRVKDVSATYKYATWTEAEDGSHYFAAGSAAKYGVRAITSVVTSNVTGNATLNRLMTDARSSYSTANTAYLNLITGVTMVDEGRQISCMDALAMLIEIYVNEKAESAQVEGNVEYDYSSVVTYTHDILVIYQDILEAEGEALRCLANLQVYAKDGTKGSNYFETVDAMLTAAANATTLKNLGIDLKSLATYRTNCINIQNAINGLAPYAELYDPDTGTGTDKVLWSQIGGYVSTLVNVGTATANGVKIGELSVSNASSVLKDPLNVVIKDGVLKDTEQRLGPALADNKISMVVDISAGLINMQNKRAYVTTSATRPTLSSNDLAYSNSLKASGEGGDEEGKDSYGIAIDLWTRTNVDDAVLTLEGTTVYETVDDTCINKNGVETELYTATNSDGTFDVYRIPDKDDTAATGEVVWYNAITHSEIGTQAEMEEAGYVMAVKTKDIVVGYDGENRIWQDMLNQQLISEYSTTQGSGSCYIFYANPSDQARILELLESFTIAFLDQYGNHIATAKLDVDNAYAINGKVTVPMVVTTGTTYIDEEGEEQMGIMALPKNTATWVTAIIYLDGNQLTNEHVLAANEIEGRLNFQFGTGTTVTGAKDGELQQKYRIITATASYGDTISDKPSNPIEFEEYVPEGRDVTVTVNVEGDQPTNISGFFVRAIGTNQGSRTEEVPFTKNEDGTWTATFKLTRPGDYYLRSVIVDGVEYALEQTIEEDDGSKRVEQLYPTVIIPGVSIGLVHTYPGSGMVLTAESYYNVEVDAQIHAAADLNPSQVRALFRSVDGSNREYTAVMTYDANNDQWVGTARITASGTYMLEYLVLDGEYEPLEESQRTTLVVTLGLSTLAKCNSIFALDDQSPVDSTEFEFSHPMYQVNMQAVIQDDAATPITKLENVVMYYRLEGSNDDDDGMIFELTWDETAGVYKGSARMTSAGTYYFHRMEVTIDEVMSTITNAPVAPVYIAAPPAPPAFDVGNTLDYQFAPGGDAYMTFNMFYAQTSQVWAVVRNTVTGQEEIVRATLDENLTEIPEGATGEELEKYMNHSRFKVTVPRTSDDTEYNGVAYKGTQDGEWEIVEIRVANTFDEEGNKLPALETVDENGDGVGDGNKLAAGVEFTDSNTLKFDVSGKSGLSTYVVQTVNVNTTASFTKTGVTEAYAPQTAVNSQQKVTTYHLGKQNDKVNGVFMDSYAAGITITVTDWSGNAIDAKSGTKMSEVQLKIVHQGDQEAKGGYQGGTYGTNDVGLTRKGNDFTTEQSLQLAGTYVTELSFKLGSVQYSTTTDASNFIPDFEVWSIKPSAAITTGTTTGTYDTQITWSKRYGTLNKFSTTSSKTSSFSAYYAEVYAQAKADNSTQKHGTFTRPNLSIAVTGIGNAESATLILPGGDSTQKTFTFTKDETKTVTLGSTSIIAEWKIMGVGHDLQAYHGHGSQTIETMTLVYNGVTYTVKLTNKLEIKNPSSVNQNK